MSDRTPATLEADDRDERLGDGGVGVLAFSTERGDPPHAVPVSYGYDAAETTFYFRLATGSGSEKEDPEGRAVAFVTYGEADEWWSVVAGGRLESVEDDAVSTEALAGLDRVHIPLFDVFGSPPADVSFSFTRLVPEDLTAYRETAGT